jgi:cytochrome c oxidase subunit 4
MKDDTISRKTYVRVWAALLALLALTAAADFVNLGPLHTPVAITIAVAKALLILLYFMHVRFSSRLTRVFAGAGFLWLAILIGLSMSDYLTRTWLPIPGH